MSRLIRFCLTLLLFTFIFALPTLAQNQATVVSAASYSAGKLTSNGLASIFGSNFCNAITGAQSLPFPTSLGGVTVRFTSATGAFSEPAGILFTSPQQVNVHIPAQHPAGLYTVTLTAPTGAMHTANVQLNTASFDIFSVNQRGTGHAAISIQKNWTDGRVTYETPTVIQDFQNNVYAMPIDFKPTNGEKIYVALYGSGMGISDHVSIPNSWVRINDSSYPILYAGTQGNFAGLDLINFEIPAHLGAGDHAVTVFLNGVATNQVTIPVK